MWPFNTETIIREEVPANLSTQISEAIELFAERCVSCKKGKVKKIIIGPEHKALWRNEFGYYSNVCHTRGKSFFYGLEIVVDNSIVGWYIK